MKTIHRSIALILALLFILFAVFQYNDPDPILWMIVYGFAAVVSLMFYLNRGSRLLYVIAAVDFLVGAIYFWPESWHGVALDPNFKYEVEHARESLGLGICALSMLYFFIFGKR